MNEEALNRPVPWKWALPFVLLSVLFFARSFSYSFVWDDVWRISKNQSTKSLNNVGKFFSDPETQSASRSLNHHTYRPLLTLSFALDHALWPRTPGAFRATNIVFHGLNGFLVAALAFVFLGTSAPAAIMAGVLFIVHPVQPESVAWVVERSNVMSLFFMLSALLIWIRADGRKRWFATAVLFLLGLFTRENCVVLPLLLWAAETWPVRAERRRRDWPMYGAMMLIALLFVALRSHVLGASAQAQFWGGSFGLNLLSVLKVVPLSIRVLLWPARLSPHYLIPEAHSWKDPGAWLGLIVWAAAVFIAWVARRKRPAYLFVLTSALLWWLPTSGIVPLIELFANRFLYPVVASAAWAAALWCDNSRIRKAVLGCVIVIFALVSSALLPVWKDEESVWTRCVQINPHDAFAWYCLGLAHQEKAAGLTLTEAREDVALSVACFRTAMTEPVVVPFLAELHFRTAQSLWAAKQRKEAEKEAAQASALSENFAEIWHDFKKDWPN